MTDEQFTPEWFSKPADSLLSLMRRRNVTASHLATTLDGGLDLLRGLLAGSLAVDERRAECLAAVLGGTSRFWLMRQANYERALDRAVAAVFETEGEDWLQRVPIPGGNTPRRLTEDQKREQLRRRLAFFNVANLRAWNRRYGSLRSETQFRTSPTLLSDEGAISMWLRQGELEAALLSTRPWDPVKLGEKLPEIRALSKIGQPTRFIPKLKDLCAQAGVAIVVKRAPKDCRASGATRLIAPDKAMILLSFRFRTDDQFWFTVFHEIGHLLLHDAKTFIDDEETFQDEREREANEFASSCIIPEARQAEFERLTPARNTVLRFSVSAGIGAGLTVGQMQHRKIIGHERLNSLKRRWTWEDIEPVLS